jgi:hypothetical protein
MHRTTHGWLPMRALGYCSALMCMALISARAGANDRMIEGFPDLPSDARNVAERYMGCQHFWGEVSGTGDERDKEVAAKLKELKCDQVEDDLLRIKVKYHDRPDILRILKEADFTGSQGS